MNYIKVDMDTSSSIIKMIDQNLNLNQISKILRSEKNIELAHPTLRGYIQRTFHKEWDKKTKKWVASEPISKSPKNCLENQLEFDMHKKETEGFQETGLSKRDSETKPQITPIDSKLEADKESVSKFQQDLTCILQKMYRLQKDVDDIKKTLFLIRDDNPKNRLVDLGDEFIRIYASEKSKSSVTVNAELKEKVKKFIEESYGIKDNDSLVINIALLLALYRGK